jgi:uncharacterized membrane protein YhaH (DUF805 family)
MEWYLMVLKKYVEFDGRSRRKEYWMFFLISFLVGIGCSIIDNVSGLTKAANGLSPLNTLYGLAVFLPGLAVSIRRLHDTGRSGWWVLIGFVPCVGWILMIIWLATDGDPGTNAYGLDPKGSVRGKMNLDSED